MTAPARARPSFDELYARVRSLPEGQTGLILEPGELIVMPWPHPKHQRAMKGLLRLLGPRRVERMPDPPDESPLRVVPDWACEILLPRQAQVASDEERVPLPPFDLPIAPATLFATRP